MIRLKQVEDAKLTWSDVAIVSETHSKKERCTVLRIGAYKDKWMYRIVEMATDRSLLLE